MRRISMNRGILFIIELNGANIAISIQETEAGSITQKSFQGIFKIPGIIGNKTK